MHRTPLKVLWSPDGQSPCKKSLSKGAEPMYLGVLQVTFLPAEFLEAPAPPFPDPPAVSDRPATPGVPSMLVRALSNTTLSNVDRDAARPATEIYVRSCPDEHLVAKVALLPQKKCKVVEACQEYRDGPDRRPSTYSLITLSEVA